MRFSSRSTWTVQANPVTQAYLSLKKQGIEVLNLTESNPTRCHFNYFHSNLLNPLLNPKNLVYDPDAHGLLETREALVHYYENQGIYLRPDQIFLTANTSEAYTFLFRLLMETGDTLLSPRPSYPLLDYLAEINDIHLRRYPLKWEEGQWQISAHLLSMMDSKTRTLLAVNPNNPTGNYVKEKEREVLNEFAKYHSFAIIADEVFFDFLLRSSGHGMPCPSFAANTEVLTFTLSGASKTLGLPQMKLSWIVVTGPEQQAEEAMRRLEIISDTYLSISTPSQNAFPAWMNQKEVIQGEILERLQSNLDFLKHYVGAGSPRPGEETSPLRLYPPEGGWNAVLELPSAKSDEEWALHLLQEAHVLVHPGYLFDFEEGSFIVFSLLPPVASFQKGIAELLKHI